LRLIATICTNRPPAAVRPALAAVCEQVSGEPRTEALLVTSGLDPATHAEHERAAAELGGRAVAAPAGISAARNAALDGLAGDDVVAYLDDDAIPDPGWLGALLSAWDDADPAVACIGGAILPRWAAEPPGWVSPRIYGAFSLLDLGRGEVQLDPAAGEDAWGANISFRAGPLREAGGFAAARGAWADVPLFGDESEVQARLANSGHRVLYRGDVRVEHQVGADRLRLRELWRRELYRGVSAGLSGATSPGPAAGRAAKALAGLAVALARRDAALAGERLARLARSTGGAAAPLMRRRLRRRGWPG
jgi:hypothetical protein